MNFLKGAWAAFKTWGENGKRPEPPKEDDRVSFLNEAIRVHRRNYIKESKQGRAFSAHVTMVELRELEAELDRLKEIE